MGEEGFTYTQTHRQHGDSISLLSLFQIKGSALKHEEEEE
jgi:hypothetical protein